MNKQSKAKLLKLAAQCELSLKNRHRQSFDIYRGEMWAVIAAVHELRRAGKLPPKETTDAD